LINSKKAPTKALVLDSFLFCQLFFFLASGESPLTIHGEFFSQTNFRCRSKNNSSRRRLVRGMFNRAIVKNKAPTKPLVLNSFLFC
jgi:hypothetical protein